MKILNKEEIKEFTKNYFPLWLDDIKVVSLIEYNGVKEYLVNRHYLVMVDGVNVVKKDLQFEF